MFDVAVIGAGMAGLMCAAQLATAGYKVVVVEKSRGLGGRVATRRVNGTRADHGTRYLKPQGELSQQLVEILCDLNLLKVWTNEEYEYSPSSQKQLRQAPLYVAPDGMSAIAKFLAQDLEILLSQRVEALSPIAADSQWRLTLDSTKEELKALAVVFAIPAPQALMVLEPLANIGLSAEFINNLRCVEFDPCLSVIAGYPADVQLNPAWKAVNFLAHSALSWVGLDSSKRMEAETPVFVVQSSAEFARRYLETEDLQPAGKQLLTHASECLQLPLNTPDWMQVHRWRYAFPSRPWHETCLSTQVPLPLVCCGDWCRGNQVEGAMLSGIAAAEQINHQLQQRSLLGMNFFRHLA